MEKELLQSPVDALQYRRTLLEIIRQLESLRSDLAMAQLDLASLINVQPGIHLELADPGDVAPDPLPWPTATMATIALENRPELKEERYQTRISQEETSKAIAKLFPGLEFSLGSNYDSNSFAVNKSWSEAGLRVTWNLMNLLSASKRLDQAEAQETVAETRRLALHMAVLSQVYVAHHQYQATLGNYTRSKTLANMDQQIEGHLRQQEANNAQSQLELIRAQVNTLLSRLRQDETFAQLQNAHGRLIASLGVDPLPANLPAVDLPSLTKAIIEQVNNLGSTHGAEEATQIQQTILAWAKAWSSRQPKTYFSHYDTSFQPANGMKLEQWQRQRRQNIQAAHVIEIDVKELQITRTDTPDVWRAAFQQNYRSDRHQDRTRKILFLLRKEGESWKIIREES